jgi:hypothetical protein
MFKATRSANSFINMWTDKLIPDSQLILIMAEGKLNVKLLYGLAVNIIYHVMDVR